MADDDSDSGSGDQCVDFAEEFKREWAPRVAELMLTIKEPLANLNQCGDDADKTPWQKAICDAANDWSSNQPRFERSPYFEKVPDARQQAPGLFEQILRDRGFPLGPIKFTPSYSDGVFKFLFGEGNFSGFKSFPPTD
jgi:hypothetical protein